MKLTLNAKAQAGSEIRETCVEMQRLSDMLDCYVDLDFNGVKCSARPGGDAELMARRQRKCHPTADKFRFVTSRP